MNLLSDATFVAAILGAAAALGTFFWQRKRDLETLRNALFAELRHIREHYQYAATELPTSPQAQDLKKLLMRSRFGGMDTVKDLGRYAILGVREMQLLLQINLRIRNTDQLIDELLHDPAAVSGADLIEVANRMEYVGNSANELIGYIQQQASRLASIPDKGRRQNLDTRWISDICPVCHTPRVRTDSHGMSVCKNDHPW